MGTLNEMLYNAIVLDNAIKTQAFKDAILMLAYDYNMSKNDVMDNKVLRMQALREAVIA